MSVVALSLLRTWFDGGGQGEARNLMARLSSQEQEDLLWVKARASQGMGMCMEVASHPIGVAVRQSAAPEDGAFLYSKDEFKAFLDGAKRGEFDHLA